jgi:hypothetical protein
MAEHGVGTVTAQVHGALVWSSSIVGEENVIHWHHIGLKTEGAHLHLGALGRTSENRRPLLRLAGLVKALPHLGGIIGHGDSSDNGHQVQFNPHLGYQVATQQD